MDALSLARWQFGVTTVHHYLFISISTGLAMFVALGVWIFGWDKVHGNVSCSRM